MLQLRQTLPILRKDASLNNFLMTNSPILLMMSLDSYFMGLQALYREFSRFKDSTNVELHNEIGQFQFHIYDIDWIS
jgi:hypothetical protein